MGEERVFINVDEKNSRSKDQRREGGVGSRTGRDKKRELLPRVGRVDL